MLHDLVTCVNEGCHTNHIVQSVLFSCRDIHIGVVCATRERCRMHKEHQIHFHPLSVRERKMHIYI